MGMPRFTHLLNVTSVDFPLPLELGPGELLTKPDGPEQTLLRALIAQARNYGRVDPLTKQYVPHLDDRDLVGAPNSMALFPYDLPRNAGPPADPERGHPPLQPEQRRYFGVRTDPGDGEGAESAMLTRLNTLTVAGRFLPHAGFDFGIDVHVNRPGEPLNMGGTGLARPWTDRQPEVELTQADIDMVLDVRRRIAAQDLNSRSPALRAATDEVHDLRRLPRKSRLLILGYFAVIESLVTHQPDPKDPYESIRRQVRTKMALVADRMSVAESFAAHFPDIKKEDAIKRSEKMWNLLYDYRSAIAHGRRDPPNEELGTHEQTLTFLVTATSVVMRFGLQEPELLAHLQRC